MEIVKIKDRPDLITAAAEWFHSKWGIPVETYVESMEDSLHETVPSWYVCLDGEKIISGLGVIENDFHERKDLTPNICAVYTEETYRCRGIAGALLDRVCSEMKESGYNTLYLLTNHVSFYERYGWKYYCMVKDEGEETQSRMYIKKL